MKNKSKFAFLLAIVVWVFFVIGAFFARRGVRDGMLIYFSTESEKKEVMAENNIPDEDIFSFAVIGDTQGFDPEKDDGGFQKVVKNISSKDVDLAIAMGDLVSSCSYDCEGKLDEWKKILGPLSAKTYATMGNHDRSGRSSADKAWQEIFNFPTNGPLGFSELAYSFDHKNSHFVILNSAKPDEHIISKDQRDWLEDDLAKNKLENIFVFFHEPAYPVSSKINESLDVEKKERDVLWDIFVKHKITAVFNGHEHIYSRKKIGNIYQFVFGNSDSFNHDAPESGMAEFSYVGKAFGIIGVDEGDITIELFSIEGALLDSFRFSR